MRFGQASLLSLLAVPALSCDHANMKRQADSNETLPFTYTEGADGPADIATQGYFINHIAFMVSNMTASKEWYSTVLGMRHVFTFELSSKLSVAYMSHVQGGRNGTGFQTGAELVRDKNNLAGMVELVEYKPNSETKKFTGTPANTLSHMGLIVPDLQAAQARYEELGVDIVKSAGSLDFSAETGPEILAQAYGFNDFRSEAEQADIQEALPGLTAMGFGSFIVIADPDGNLFEVQSLNPEGI